MERQFSMPFQTNVYLTPAGAQGFKAHYDTHDVFVLQVLGSKTWELGAWAMALPLRGQAFEEAAEHAFGEPTRVFELRAGDLAYVPRGLMHRARSGGEASLHITLGALSYTWADFMLEAVSSLCLADGSFRKALPVGFAGPAFDREAARAVFEELIERLKAGSEASFTAAFDTLVEKFLSSRRPLLPGQLREMMGLAALTKASWVGARPDLVYRLGKANGRLLLQGHGRELELPEEAEAAVRFALSAERFRVGDLHQVADMKGRLLLVGQLVRDGFLRQVDGPATQGARRA